MAPSLENSPDEITEAVVQLLGLDDIRSLRLCSRAIATKCSRGYFKSFFFSKRVELTEVSLHTFAEAIRPSMLGCLIQELTLVGITKLPKGSELVLHDISQEEKTALLTKIFSQLVTNSVNGKLPSLILEVAVLSKTGEKLLPSARQPPHGDPNWKRVWQGVRDTFRTTWQALAASSLPIEKLNLFNGGQMQRCSLPTNYLGEVDWGHPGLTASFASLRSVSVSLCEKDIDDYKADGTEGPYSDGFEDDPIRELRDEDDIQAELDEEVNFLGLASLLRLCGQLDYFETHHYVEVGSGNDKVSRRDEWLFQRVAESHWLPKIQHCCLRGICIREQDLLAIVQRINACKLSMTNVHLISGTYRSFLDYCEDQNTPVEAIYFDDLYEKNRLIYFDAPGPQKFPRRTPTEGCLTLQRTGAEVKAPLLYHYAIGRALGSPSTQNWLMARRREYGN